eukprot:11173710-Lingulodinium_polyedra.AAC.1
MQAEEVLILTALHTYLAMRWRAALSAGSGKTTRRIEWICSRTSPNADCARYRTKRKTARGGNRTRASAPICAQMAADVSASMA